MAGVSVQQDGNAMVHADFPFCASAERARCFFALLRPHDDVDHHHNGDDIGDEIREVRAQVFLQAQADGVKKPNISAAR